MGCFFYLSVFFFHDVQNAERKGELDEMKTTLTTFPYLLLSATKPQPLIKLPQLYFGYLTTDYKAF